MDLQKLNEEKEGNPSSHLKTRPQRNMDNKASDQPATETDMKWHSLSDLFSQERLTASLFFNLILTFGSGHKQLAFCDCAACDEGFRDMLALLINVTEKKNLKASSPEIVTRAREMDRTKFKLDFSKFFTNKICPSSNADDPGNVSVGENSQNSGKIVIEIGSEAIENAVFNVLKSDKGQEVLRFLSQKKPGRPSKGKSSKL
ncbi:MAG: hypothetical protein ABFC24_11515 [Methanoregulaceae archaeon]